MNTKLIFALVAFLSSNAFAALQTPLPEFKNDKQLAEWRAEKASEATSQSHAAEETAFYTGKPYIESSSGYAFKYRSYNPELARWTSEDPSGFPDGANANIYAPNPNSAFDPDGLSATQIFNVRYKGAKTCVDANSDAYITYVVTGKTISSAELAWGDLLGSLSDDGTGNRGAWKETVTTSPVISINYDTDAHGDYAYLNVHFLSTLIEPEKTNPLVSVVALTHGDKIYLE